MPEALAALGPGWTWIVAGLALAGAELVLPGIFLIWLGLAALLTGIATLLVAMPWQAQALLFAVLTPASVGLASVLQRRRPASALNRPDRGLIGREGVLCEAIADGMGGVRFDDTLWRAAGPDLPAGTRVRVTGIEGTVLRVAAI